MKRHFCRHWFNYLACLLSLFAVLKCEPIEMDWVSVLVGILSLLVTVLIGWQIYNSIDLNRKVDCAVKKCEEVELSINKTKSKIDGGNLSLDRYVTASTDFVQGFTLSSIKDKRVLMTFKLFLSSLNHYLHSVTDITNNIEACLTSLEDCLKRASEELARKTLDYGYDNNGVDYAIKNIIECNNPEFTADMRLRFSRIVMQYKKMIKELDNKKSHDGNKSFS